MWFRFTFLLLIGAAVTTGYHNVEEEGEHEHGWRQGNEYRYLIQSRTLASKNRQNGPYVGILSKGIFVVQVKSPDVLRVKIEEPTYARVNRAFPEGWDAEIPDQPEYRDMPLSGETFEVVLKHGLIRNVLVGDKIPIYEVNLMKSILSQLQLDTQGENAIKERGMQRADGDVVSAVFRAIEDSVTGKCEVSYDISPTQISFNKQDPDYINIIKTKDFSRCEQKPISYYGILKPGLNHKNRHLIRTSVNRAVIKGNLKRFTIQSSVTTEEAYVRPNIYLTGSVYSKINLTLDAIKKFDDVFPASNSVYSTGNLVYIYNKPFENNRVSRGPALSRDSLPDRDSVSSDSSSEERHRSNDILQFFNSASESNEIVSDEDPRKHNFETDTLEPRPTMFTAPKIPLAPFFVGYYGNGIHDSDKVDLVPTIIKFIDEIKDDLKNNNNLPSHETVEKFTILISLIRTADRTHIIEVDKTARTRYQAHNNLKEYAEDEAVFWFILRDVIAQAGTGPALLTIREWIKTRRLEGLEAAKVLAHLPRTAHIPTTAYLDAVFDLIKLPEVSEQKILRGTAVVAFAELVRRVNADPHNYPINVFGPMIPRNDQSLTETYLPYLSSKLNEAVEKRDSSQIQAYALALGFLGHPKVLAQLEPLLEGKQKLSILQRQVVVVALHALAETNPVLVRNVLYKIYLNRHEAFEVRCTAAFLLIKTNPPKHILMHMAALTRSDTNKHVKSVVKSSIENVAQIELPDYRDFVKKARVAQRLLTRENFDDQYSKGYTISKLFNDREFAYRFSLEIISGNNARVPETFFYSNDISTGGLDLPSDRFGWMVSSGRQLLGHLGHIFSTKKKETHHQEPKPSAAKKIAQALNLEPEDIEQLEGNVMNNSPYNLNFFPFDRNSLEEFSRALKEWLKSLNNDEGVNLNYFDSYDVSVGFPSETGIPVTFNLKEPRLFRVVGGKQQLEIDDESNIKAKVKLHLLVSGKVQSRVGVLVPFEHQHYVAGSDAKLQVYFPIEFNGEFKFKESKESKKKDIQMQWRLMANKPSEKINVFHFSIVPFTTAYDVLNLRPLLLRDDTHITLSGKIQEDSYSSGILSVHTEKDGADNRNIEKVLQSTEDYLRKIDVYVNTEIFKDADFISVNIAHEVKEVKNDVPSESKNDEIKVPSVKNKVPNSEERRENLMKESCNNILYCTGEVVDVSVQVPNENKIVLTMATAGNEVERKKKVYVYMNMQSNEGQVVGELCAAGQIQSSPGLGCCMDFEKAMEATPETKMNVEVNMGETCEQGEKIKVTAHQTRSDDFRKAILQSKVARKCQQDLKEGNKGTQACQQAIKVAQVENEAEIVLSVPKHVFNITDTVTHYVNEYVADTNSISPINVDENTVNMKMKFSPDFRKGFISMHTSNTDVAFPPVDTSSVCESQSDDADPIENVLRCSPIIKTPAACVVDESKVVTFDGKSFQNNLGNCWYLIAATFPEEYADISGPEMVILARENKNHKKEVIIVMGIDEISLKSPNDQPEVRINGQEVKVAQHEDYQHKGENTFNIYRSQNAIKVRCPVHETDVMYDGKHVRVEVSDKYHKKILGICGNYDGESENEFLSPRKCFMSTPEEFVASYALTEDSCEESVVQDKLKADNTVCVRPAYYQTDVISDEEAGRVPNPYPNWGYHHNKQKSDKLCNPVHHTKVVEKEDQICFSVRPLPSCPLGCQSARMKQKKYALHCLQNNEVSRDMKRRVEEGANPDMTNKQVDVIQTFVIPTACYSAE